MPSPNSEIILTSGLGGTVLNIDRIDDIPTSGTSFPNILVTSQAGGLTNDFGSISLAGYTGTKTGTSVSLTKN
jgi:hypothetical protein